jgi:hypothetical protein
VAAREREQRQIEVMELIEARSVGKAAFDALGGWNPAGTPPADDKKFFMASSLGVSRAILTWLRSWCDARLALRAHA